MATEDQESETVGSALIQELSQQILAADEKVQTTLRLRKSVFRRLKEQEQRWHTSMSMIADRAIEAVLEELENSDPPKLGE